MNKLNNIINLSKLFILENNNSYLDLIDKENKRINKKSTFFWIILILFIGISYISYELIYYLKQAGQLEIFLSGYFLFLEILLIFQTIMLSTNIFYFSKDIENILHLPFKPIEILISKFNTLIFMLYGTELIFALFPLIIYGIYADVGILFFINLILVLIIFPIFIGLIVSVIMMFLMKTIKLFKNKDLMQLIISVILIFLILIYAGALFKYSFTSGETTNQEEELVLNNINEKIKIINNYFLTINPSINILTQNNILKIILYFFELILINLFGFFIFYFLGKKFYLKQLLKNNFYIKNKNNKNINWNKKCKENKISKAYIKKEFKLLLKNPLFFIQSVYPVVLMTITVSILLIILIPIMIDILNMEEYKEIMENMKFDFEAACLILGLLQIVGLFNFSSVTAFSREGQDAYIMKSFPINFYKQFIYKNIPQILLNIILSVFILGVIFYEIPAIGFKYIFIIFILNILFIFINSFILCLIDLINPKINWNAEYELLKNNKNKLLQYILIFLNILFLYYLDKIFIDHNLDISLLLFAFILLFIFVVMNLFINKYKNKLFERIS